MNGLPTEWDSVPLGDVLDRITYGFTNPMPTTNSGPFMVTAKDIRDGRIDYASARRTSSDAYRDRLTDKSRPRIGDVLLTKDGSIGRVARCDQPDVCINQSVALLQPNERVDSRFLTMLLQAPAYQTKMAADADGSTIKHIYITRVDKMHIGLPPLHEQRAIAEVLGAIDDKIAANTTLIQTANDLAAALTRASLYGAFEALGDAADIVMGSSPPGTSYNESGDGTVFYQGVRDFGVRQPTNRVWTTEPARMAAATDTLVSVRAPVGRTNLASERTCIGRGLAAVRSRAGRPMTLFHLLRDQPDVWAPFESEGTVFGSINKKQLAAIPVGVVAVERAASLETELSGLERRIASALSESEKLATTRDALLPGLMSGKIRVKDAEKVVEGVV